MNRRHLKSLLRSLPATALVLAFPFAAVPAAADAAPTARGTGIVQAATGEETDAPSVSIEIDAESAEVDRDEPLRLTVTVDNTTGVDLASGRIVVSAGSSTIGSRETLHAHLDGTDPLPTATELVDLAVPEIEADTSFTSSTLVIPHERLTMPADYGAVPLVASFRSGTETAAGYDTYLAAATAPSNTIELALAMPITAPTGQNGLISSDSLATYTAPGGVLTRQLDGAAGRDVALGVDPMIVASIRALGTGAPATATAWLDRLASVSNPTFPLQFADADGAVQAAAGLDSLLAPTSLDFAVPEDYTAVVPTETPTADPSAAPTTPTTDGTDEDDPTNDPAADLRPTAEELLDFEWTMDDVLWPAEGTVTAADLDVFAGSGVQETILGSGNLTDGTTHPAASRAGEHGVLVSDDTLSAALRAASSAVTESAYSDAVSTAAAELAVSAREQGATGRAVLATLDRGWPPTASRLSESLDSVLRLPTVDGISLTDVRSEPRIEAALAPVEADASRTGAVSLLIDREARLAEFSSVLVSPELLTGRERVQILTLLSVDWMDTREEWTQALVAHGQQTSDLLGSVSILNSSDVLLVGNESAIPFGVRNDSPYDVRVQVDATPSNIRLDVGDPQTVEVAAQSRQTVRVPVKAQLGNGDVGLTVTLSSGSGVAIGAPVTATVAVRADWEGIGAIVAVVLVSAMFVAGVVRTVLRRRARIAARGAATSSGAAPAETDQTTDQEERA